MRAARRPWPWQHRRATRVPEGPWAEDAVVRSAATNLQQAVAKLQRTGTHLQHAVAHFQHTVEICNIPSQICNTQSQICNMPSQICNMPSQISKVCNITSQICNTQSQICNMPSQNAVAKHKWAMPAAVRLIISPLCQSFSGGARPRPATIRTKLSQNSEQ